MLHTVCQLVLLLSVGKYSFNSEFELKEYFYRVAGIIHIRMGFVSENIMIIYLLTACLQKNESI